MPRHESVNGGYLIAKPAGFPGVAIPLLSDDECRARGIDHGGFPPRESWTQDQRDAADRLAEMLGRHVIREALQVISTETEGMSADSELSESPLRAQTGARFVTLG